MSRCVNIIIFDMIMDNIEIGKVDAKKRKVFKDSKDRTYVKQGDKKVYVKKLFTPKRNAPSSPEMPVVINRGPGLSPMINIKKVDAKKKTHAHRNERCKARECAAGREPRRTLA